MHTFNMRFALHFNFSGLKETGGGAMFFHMCYQSPKPSKLVQALSENKQTKSDDGALVASAGGREARQSLMD
jgi:hypothetical protein